jgi:hypothetical protein
MKKNIASKLSSKILIAGTLIGMVLGNLGCSVLQDLRKDLEELTEPKVNLILYPDPSASAYMKDEGAYPLIPSYH